MNFRGDRVAPEEELPAPRFGGIDPDGEAPINRENAEANVNNNNDNPQPHNRPVRNRLVPSDPSRMLLTETEHARAVAIKQAISQDSELEMEFSDFDVAQIALLDQDNVEAAVQRAHALQAFKQEYQVADTLDHGNSILKQCEDLFPGLFLSVSYSPPLERHVIAGDVTKFKKSILSDHNRAQTLAMVSFYYVFHAVNPDFASIRQGVIMLVECGGFSWSENFKLGFFKRFWLELGATYPFRIHHLKHFHTTLFFNLLHAMGRPFLPNDVKGVFEIGCYSLLGRLDQVYQIPTPQAASARLLSSFQESLQARYENVKSFSL